MEALAYFLVINCLTLIFFLADKVLAMMGAWRISESTLLLAAMMGGSVGAKLGQWMFQHKTCKQPFVFFLNVIVAVHISMLVFALHRLLSEIAMAKVR